MLNQVVLVGRLTKEMELVTRENDKTLSDVIIAVQRSYKNTKGEYDTDFIKCRLYNGVATNTKAYCKKGDLIGIRGHLEIRQNELLVITDRVTFLSTKPRED